MNTENNTTEENVIPDSAVNVNTDTTTSAKPEQTDSTSLAKLNDEEHTKSTPENSTATESSDATTPADKSEEKPGNSQADPEPIPQKLSDILSGEGTNIVYISGTVGGQDFDCAGPIEMPFKFTQPMWPYTPVKPNPDYKNQIFDYASSQWIPTDAKSQGQILTDLNKKVTKLENSNEVAEQTQKATMQTTMLLGQLINKVDTLTGKIDVVSNDKKEVVKND